MRTSPAQLVGLRRSAQHQLVVAYITVIVITVTALLAGGAWVADSLTLQAAAESSAASSSAQLSCANQILGYAVNIGSAPPDSVPVQLVVDLQQSVQRCDDAWQQATAASAGVKLDQIDSASRTRLSTQVSGRCRDWSAGRFPRPQTRRSRQTQIRRFPQPQIRCVPYALAR